MSCLSGSVGAAAGVPLIAADLLRGQISAVRSPLRVTCCLPGWVGVAIPPTAADLLHRQISAAPGHKRTEVRPPYFGLRGNGMNPSRFGIFTLGSDCASITSFDPTIPLRLRI
jgi:hypothetical protein